MYRKLKFDNMFRISGYTVQSSQLDHFYTNKKLHKSLHFCLNNYINEKVTYKVTYKISFPDKCFLRRGIVKRHETFNFVD